MKINALAPWYGAKRKLAPRIVEAIGHDGGDKRLSQREPPNPLEN